MPDTQTQLRKGTTAQNAIFTGAQAEISYDTTLNRFIAHDGILAGGFPAAHLHLAQTFPQTQTFANTENFFGNVAAGATVVKFLSTPGAGFATLDFNSNGTPDLNFIRKYNSTPFQIEIGGSGGIDVVTDTNSNETSADIRFLTNGIRGSGTQTLLATFRDNGSVDLTGSTTIAPKVNTEGLRVTSFSLTGASAASMVALSGTLNTAGSPTLIDLDMAVVAFGASTKLIGLRLAGAPIFSVFHDGSIDVAAASVFNWIGRSTITSPSDGVIRLSNDAQTDFNRLQFGGTAGTFPALGRNANSLELFNADGGAGSNTFLIYNLKAAATDFERLNIGFPGGADATIWTEAGTTGAGIARDLVLGADATERMRITAVGEVTWGGGVSWLDTDGRVVINSGNIILYADGAADFAGTGVAVNITPGGALNWGSTSTLGTDGSISIAGGGVFSADATTGRVTILNVLEMEPAAPAIGFFGAALGGQASIADLDNQMTTTGTANTIEDFAGALYATDGPVIAGDIYQLAQKIIEIRTALVAYGLLA